MKFYTNVFQIKNTIYHYYIENGKRKRETVRYKPSLGIRTKKETKWTDIYDSTIGMIRFESIFEMYQWRKEHKDHSDIFGDIHPTYQFIADTYPNEIVNDASQMKVFNIDIEVDSSQGFPQPHLAKFPITAITIQDLYKDKFYVLGCQKYIPKDERVQYFQCKDESVLLRTFIDFISKARPDAITGWNTETFDIPYVINRAKRILEKGYFLKLSPVREIGERKIDYLEGVIYTITGIAHLDYMRLYKKYRLEPRESFSLNAICEIELEEQKLSYHEEYGTLAELYEQNFEKFIDYNIRDVELVAWLNQKLRYIELILTMANLAKCNLEDSFGSVKIWEVFLYNELLKRNKQLPPKNMNAKEEFPGGFVKEPEPGMKEWLVVWDITSSYPNQIISFNLSPETIVEDVDLPQELFALKKMKQIDGFVDLKEIEKITPLLKKHNVSMTANCEFFTKEKYGVFPQIIAEVFNGRKDLKNKSKKLYQELQDLKKKNVAENIIEKKQNEYTSVDAKQFSLKIFMNSFYGVFSNEWFRFFDIRLAGAVTCMGQVCVKGPAKYLKERLPITETVYSDTDSLFIDMSKVIEKRFPIGNTPENIRDFIILFSRDAIAPIISEYYEKLTDGLNAYKNTYEMDFETIADKTLFVGKKRYIMNQIYKDGYLVPFDGDPDLKTRGVEIVRTSTPRVVRFMLKDMVKLIIKTNDNNQCIDFIEKFKKKFQKMPFDAIANPRGVNGLSKYNLKSKGCPIHVRAAHVYNEALKSLNLDKVPPIQEGDKIKFCYIKEPNSFGQNVMGCVGRMPNEVQAEFKIDYDLQFEKAALAPIRGFFDALSWNIEKTASLENFFE